ncbi:MAG: zinc ABC transporter substrate-binding protein, partial [Bacteroidota bacterium]
MKIRLYFIIKGLSLLLGSMVWGIGSLMAKPRVIATTTFIADMAQVIAGEDAEVISLMPIGGDPHLYDPVPGDAKLIAGAALILRNGLTLEGWLNEMIENSGTRAPLITVTEGVAPIKSADHPDAADPHAWMDLHHAEIYVHNIKDALVSLDPAHAANYQDRHDAYVSEIRQLDAYIKQQIALIPVPNRVLVTSHDAFRYFGNRYGLRVESIMGTSTDAEARVEDVTHLISVLTEYKVPAVFLESTINPKVLQQLANDQGVRVGGKLFADS